MSITKTSISRSATALVVGLVTIATLTGACDSSSTKTSGACAPGGLRCVCYANDTCDSGLTCISDTCVSAGSTEGTGGSTSSTEPPTVGGNSTNGSGGSTTSNGTGGSTVAGEGGANASGGTTAAATGGTTATGSGGTTTVATGGTTATGSGGTTTAATGGTTATGSGGTTTVATGGTTATGSGGTTTVATGGATAVINSPIIDAFTTCDENIENNGGRSGKWYYFADSDYNATHAYGDPGTQWADHGCAAWMLLGCTGTACTYAGLGFQLAGGNPYDLSSYTGISVAFEGKDNVYFVVKTSDGGYFGAWLTGTTGNQTRNADFANLAAMANSATSSLNTRLVTEMQFTVGKTLALNAGFGLAIHSVSLR